VGFFVGLTERRAAENAVFSLQSRLFAGDFDGRRFNASSRHFAQASGDVRVVGATFASRETMVQGKKTAGDVVLSLERFSNTSPPLEKNGGSIFRCLACHYLAHYRREAGRPPMAIVHAAMQRLVEHEWLGNVRQLMTVMNRAAFWRFRWGFGRRNCSQSAFDDNSRGDLPAESLQEMGSASIFARRFRRAQWQKRHASEILGISRPDPRQQNSNSYGLAEEKFVRKLRRRSPLMNPAFKSLPQFHFPFGGMLGLVVRLRDAPRPILAL